MPTPAPSMPSGSWPLFGSVTLQGVTRAATESTLDSGPMVAASSGMAVEANHHCLWRRRKFQPDAFFLFYSSFFRRPGAGDKTQTTVFRKRGRADTHCGRSSLRARSLSGPRLLMVSDGRVW